MKEIMQSEWVSWIKIILVAFLIAVVARMFIFTPIVVDGHSMQPTLHNKDQMIVNKFLYKFEEPERFDIIVFHATETENYIKRVIGLPGEHIAVSDDVLYVDGEKVEEPFLEEEKKAFEDGRPLTYDFTIDQLPGHYTTVPENHVLVLGDNRRNSSDSRVLGMISMDEIVGKTSFIYWPFSRLEILPE